MKRTLVGSALVGCLVVGAAGASILGRDAVPLFGSAAPLETAGHPVANRTAKASKLPVVVALSAANIAAQNAAPSPVEPAPAMPEQLRMAFAADSPVAAGTPGVAARNLVAPVAIPPSVAPVQPKMAAKPQPQPAQKTYTLLSDAQIAGIRGRLRLDPSQESYWPGVESALRAIARKMHSTKQVNPSAGAPPIDPDSDEVSQLKSAALPLLFTLREDQKREVRALARVIGLEAVAQRI